MLKISKKIQLFKYFITSKLEKDWNYAFKIQSIQKKWKKEESMGQMRTK